MVFNERNGIPGSRGGGCFEEPRQLDNFYKDASEDQQRVSKYPPSDNRKGFLWTTLIKRLLMKCCFTRGSATEPDMPSYRNCRVLQCTDRRKQDKGKIEELAFSVRYYTDKVQERFLSMTALAEFDAEAISAVTKDQTISLSEFQRIAYYQPRRRWR